MHIIHSYYLNILKQDFLTKFHYRNCYELPSLEKVVLVFSVTQISLRILLPSLTSLFLISSQKPILKLKNRINLTVRVKSGTIVSCRVDLRNINKFKFIESLLFFIIPKVKEYALIIQNKTVHFTLENLFLFKQIEKNYEFFQNLPKLNVILFFKASTELEIAFFLSALKIFSNTYLKI